VACPTVRHQISGSACQSLAHPWELKFSPLALDTTHLWRPHGTSSISSAVSRLKLTLSAQSMLTAYTFGGEPSCMVFPKTSSDVIVQWSDLQIRFVLCHPRWRSQRYAWVEHVRSINLLMYYLCQLCSIQRHFDRFLCYEKASRMN